MVKSQSTQRMMKISSKASPGRGDKAFMRFVKGNASSRRCRSSPLFFRKKVAAVVEPSSPKVTCMGQVRVRSTTRRCKPQPLFSPHWRSRCAAFFQPSCRKGSREPQMVQDKSDDVVAEHEQGEASSSNTPPRNAFLLTRSRSAPYRSSSLATRFWGTQETEQLNTSEDRDSGQESRTEEKSEEEEEEEGVSIRDATVKSNGCVSVQPSLLLTRSKSEPARTAADKLGTDTNFWKFTRFADADSRS